jgi:glycosyltransferase involved in cell wall biosynthesis
MVFPRLRDRLTDMVTPLKPLESMYLGACVVASNVGGHRELIRSGTTGLLFEAGSPSALAEALCNALGDNALRASLRANAREYVMSERLWSHMAQKYGALYETLIKRANAHERRSTT